MTGILDTLVSKAFKFAGASTPFLPREMSFLSIRGPHCRYITERCQTEDTQFQCNTSKIKNIFLPQESSECLTLNVAS